MKNILLPSAALFAAILCMYSCKTNGDIFLSCPADLAITVPAVPVSTASLVLPQAIVSTTCEDGGVAAVLRAETELKAGVNTLRYEAADDCGNKESCSFEVNITADFRAAFVGNYKGYRDCTAHNVTQTIPDQDMTITVDYGKQANYLHVGDDEVLIDSNGSFPHPYFGSYRLYALSFKADSMFRMQQWGALNSNQTCYFRGQKQ